MHEADSFFLELQSRVKGLFEMQEPKDDYGRPIKRYSPICNHTVPSTPPFSSLIFLGSAPGPDVELP